MRLPDEDGAMSAPVTATPVDVTQQVRRRLRVVAYLRVSTDVQAEHGLGLDVQREAVRAWAKAHGARVVAWHADEGVSGSNGLETREALPSVLEALRDGTASAVVVYRLDRLARDLVLQEQLLADVWRMGCAVYSCSPAETSYLTNDPDDPSRKLIRQVLGAVNEYERSMISLRLRSGRRRKHERGGYAYGSPAFGYRAEGGELVPHAQEQAVLERMKQLQAEGLSLREIGASLTAEGHKPKRGGDWHPETLRRALRRL